MDGSEEIAAHWELRRLKDLGRCISCVCHTTRAEGPGLPAGPLSGPRGDNPSGSSYFSTISVVVATIATPAEFTATATIV